MDDGSWLYMDYEDGCGYVCLECGGEDERALVSEPDEYATCEVCGNLVNI